MRSSDRRSLRRASVAAVVFATVAAVLAFSPSARATPNFPGAVKAHLQLAAEPACTLCHAGPPGRGTVNTPFGKTMRSRGLVAYDDASLRTALDALAAENKDSDGDGVPDIRELKEGTDPNAGPGGSDDVTPEYGCAVARTRAGRSRSSLAIWPALATLLFVALRVVRVRAR
jgi:hypothetical protein